MTIKCATAGCKNEFYGMEGKEDSCSTCLKKVINPTKYKQDLCDEAQAKIEALQNKSTEADTEKLKEAMEYWCGTYAKCDGYMHALEGAFGGRDKSIVVDFDDNNLSIMESLALKFCSSQHLRAGYMYALSNDFHDQVVNHYDDQEARMFEELLAILNK